MKFFQSLQTKSNVSDLVAWEPSREILDDGLFISFGENRLISDINSLTIAPIDSEFEENIFRTFLSQLCDEKKCFIIRGGVLIPWSTYFSLLQDDEYIFFVKKINAPNIAHIVPFLSSYGSVSDSIFKINIREWRLKNQTVNVEIISLPLVKVNGVEFLLSEVVLNLLKEIKELNQLTEEHRTQVLHERYWGDIRCLAKKSGALLDLYLSSTIILTPQTLRLPIKNERTPFGRVLTVEPTFQDAPNQWISEFDKYLNVQTHYDVIDDDRRIRVILSEPVRKILAFIKKDMPARKISGSKAEKFIRNPKAFLDDETENVIDDKEFEEDRVNSNIPVTSFHLEQNINRGLIVSVNLIINEFYPDNSHDSSKEEILVPQELSRLIFRIKQAIQNQREFIEFKEWDLSLDANAIIELDLMETILRVWESQEIYDSSFISLDDIVELTFYSHRVEGIGPARPIFIPVLQKERAESDENRWLPDNLTPLLKVFLQSEKNPSLIPLSQDWITQFEKKIVQAEKFGGETIQDSRIPSALNLLNARALLNDFKSLLSIGSNQPYNGSFDKIKKSNKKKIVPLIKTNFYNIDYTEDRKKLLKISPGTKPKLPLCLRSNIHLKAHQIFGIAWIQNLLSKAPDVVRGCLQCDDMGLGKTIQLLNVIARSYEDDPNSKPSLVLVPKSLLINWENEINKFFTDDFPSYKILYGNTLSLLRKSKDSIDVKLQELGAKSFLQHNWIGSEKLIITTYEVLLQFEFSFAREDFDIVICDEAQYIKNPTTQIARAVKSLKAKFRIACTGTPVENSLVDLWCLFDFVQPGLLKSLEEFSQSYRRPIECQTEDHKIALEELQSVIKPQIIRRTKEDIADDLPSKFFAVTSQQSNLEYKLELNLSNSDVLKVKMTDYQRSLYKSGLKKMQDARKQEDSRKRSVFSFGALHFIKMVCAEPYCLPDRKFLVDERGTSEHLENSPKLAWLLDKLIEVENRDEKAIIFTEYKNIQCAIRCFLQIKFPKIKPHIINGDSSNRQNLIDEFSEDAGFGVIIISPKAAGAGVNITAANHVFHFTRMWNPAKETQSTDRAFRIGQTKDVFVYCPIVVDDVDQSYKTFDEKLDHLLKKKTQLANSAIDGDKFLSMLNGFADDVRFTELLMSDGGITPNTSAKNLTMNDIDRLDGNAFEQFCSLLYSKQEFITQITPKTGGDGGIDIIAIRGNVGVLIQCKSSQKLSIGWDAIKEVVGGSFAYQKKRPRVRFQKIAITNQAFNLKAVEQAKINNVELVTREEIQNLIVKYPILDTELDEVLLNK